MDITAKTFEAMHPVALGQKMSAQSGAVKILWSSGLRPECIKVETEMNPF